LSTTTVNVWPGTTPGVPDNSNPEVDTTTPKDNVIAGKPLIRLGNVTSPTLTIYKTKGKKHWRCDRRLPRWGPPHSGDPLARISQAPLRCD